MGCRERSECLRALFFWLLPSAAVADKRSKQGAYFVLGETNGLRKGYDLICFFTRALLNRLSVIGHTVGAMESTFAGSKEAIKTRFFEEAGE